MFLNLNKGGGKESLKVNIGKFEIFLLCEQLFYDKFFLGGEMSYSRFLPHPYHNYINKDVVRKWGKCVPDNVVNISIAVSLYRFQLL